MRPLIIEAKRCVVRILLPVESFTPLAYNVAKRVMMYDRCVRVLMRSNALRNSNFFGNKSVDGIYNIAGSYQINRRGWGQGTPNGNS